MIKFKIYLFVLIVTIGIGAAAYKVCDVWENSQKHDTSVPSEKSLAGEPGTISGPAGKGKKASMEELASRGEKVSVEEALVRIDQANAETKKLAEKFNISAMIEHLRKGELLELVKDLRGMGQEKQAEALQKGVQAELTKRTEKDNTSAVQAEIDRLKAEQKNHLRKKETAGQTE